MSAIRSRQILRLFHILAGFAIGAYVYSPSLAAMPGYAAFIQFGVFPALGLSGLIMWRYGLFKRMVTSRG